MVPDTYILMRVALFNSNQFDKELGTIDQWLGYIGWVQG